MVFLIWMINLFLYLFVNLVKYFYFVDMNKKLLGKNKGKQLSWFFYPLLQGMKEGFK